MKNFLTLSFLWTFCLNATPTSVFWTPCTTEVVPVGVGTLGTDCYFKLFPDEHKGQILSPIIGLTVGVLNWYDWKMEAGFDYIPSFPSTLISNEVDTPFLFNTKLAIDECRLFRNAPSFSVGFYNIGVTTTSALNIVDLVVGKKLPCHLSGGELYLGVYRQSKTFGRDKAGFMVAYQKRFCKDTYCDDVDYYKWIFAADYASGKNESGAGGVALYYFFSPYVSVTTGPTFFNDASIYGSWKWAIFFTVSFPIVTCKNPYQAKKPKKSKEQESTKSGKQEETSSNRSNSQQRTKDPKQEET